MVTRGMPTKRISAPCLMSATGAAAEATAAIGSPRSSLTSPKSRQQRRATIQILPRKQTEREITLPNTNTKIKRTNSITFSESVRVKQIVPIKSLIGDSEESLSQIWYMPDEFDDMKEECAELVNQMSESSDAIVALSEHDPKLLQKLLKSIRGLEKYLNSEEVLDLRYKAWDSVLDEQEYQMMDGYFDENEIAEAYRRHTTLSRMQAWQRGQQDADESLNMNSPKPSSRKQQQNQKQSEKKRIIRQGGNDPQISQILPCTA